MISSFSQRSIKGAIALRKCDLISILVSMPDTGDQSVHELPAAIETAISLLWSMMNLAIGSDPIARFYRKEGRVNATIPF